MIASYVFHLWGAIVYSEIHGFKVTGQRRVCNQKSVKHNFDLIYLSKSIVKELADARVHESHESQQLRN